MLSVARFRQSRSIAGPAVLVILYVVVAFMASIAAKGGRTCIKDVAKDVRVVELDVMDFSWVRANSGIHQATVVFAGSNGPVTATCTFRDDTHVVTKIDYREGDWMREFISATGLSWLPF